MKLAALDLTSTVDTEVKVDPDTLSSGSGAGENRLPLEVRRGLVFSQLDLADQQQIAS